ncbi:hypothetical protein ACO1O0_001131 [Amphichorda felina]
MLLTLLQATLACQFFGHATSTPVRSRDAQVKTPCKHGPDSRSCWGEYSVDTDYLDTTPDTGVTREYWLNAELITIAPDGYETQALAMNGSIPGPTIEADWGDEIVIHVTNNIPENGYTPPPPGEPDVQAGLTNWPLGPRSIGMVFGSSIPIHMTVRRPLNQVKKRGARLIPTYPCVGVPGVTECPTAPGETKTYRFRATQYGTSWYHSHFTLQAAMGLMGPIVIHGPATANYDIDLGTFMITEWFHDSVFHIWEVLQKKVALIQPKAENGLINGMNTYDCSESDDPACLGTGKRAETTFQKGKKHRMRIVGSQADGYMKFAVDGHKLTVIAADFVPIVPYRTDSVILSSGQRYDVIVEASQDVGVYWMRAIYQTACNQNTNENDDNILGIVRYEGADPDAEPTTEVNPDITNSCGDEPYGKLVPWVSHQVGPDSIKKDIALQWYYELSTVFHWTLNTKTLIIDWEDPTLLDVYHRNQTEWPRNSNVVTVDLVDQWVYWVVKDLTIVNAFHPMHLHGHDFYVLAQGRGPFVPGLVKLNLDNPPRRDTASLMGNGYTVIAFKTDNPGSWLFHCHIAWHASQGLSLQMVERQAEMAAQMDDIVDDMYESCAAWSAWYEDSHYKQDDSGI